MHTLLSIPFAVLHQTPRLASMAPLTSYQSDVLRLAVEITRLCAWTQSQHPDHLVSLLQRPPRPHALTTQFQNAGSVGSRTSTTLGSIWPRTEEARQFRGLLGVPAPMLIMSGAANGVGHLDIDTDGSNRKCDDDGTSISSDDPSTSRPFIGAAP
ncbi:hypothetical protein C8R46DRAFT_89566 [Mycena filopes]|nr:hypothetical protein C8R46DRAFT_89566 [Mycena filopes]